MREILRSWAERKLNRYYAIERPAQANEVWQRQTNGQMYARVVLSARPAESFSFRCQVTWPDKAASFEQAVLDGILDALCARFMPVLGAAFVLEDIRLDERTSTVIAFYMAARQATEKIIKGNIQVFPPTEPN